MSRIWRTLFLLVAVACAVAAAALSARPRVERYVESKGYCARCHAEQTQHTGAHADARCQDCHVMPQREPFAQLVDALRGSLPAHGELNPAACKSCHEKDTQAWSALSRTAGHKSHAAGPNAPACITCHGPSLHEKPAASERCEACHADSTPKAEPGMQLDCTRCHVFGSRGDRSRSAPKPGSKIWGSDITGERVHGAADCQLCHNPHREKGTADLTAAIECTSCHRADLARSVTHAPENHQVCTTCHRPHGLRSELATACTMCHEKPRVRGELHDAGVPEDKRGLASIAPLLAAQEKAALLAAQAKPKTTAGATAAAEATPEASSATPPGVTHDGKCATCHTPHSWAPDKDSCMSCHEHAEKAKQIAALPADTHTCIGCHEPHSPPPAASACAQCHSDKSRSLQAAKPAKHHDCLSCHEPHEAKPRAFQACGASCHGAQAAKLERGQPKHRDCVSCHEPHADPKQGAQLACKSCHAEKVASFGVNKHETCSKCHAEHVFDGKAALAGCGDCHAAPVAQGASHHDECTKCHTPHAPGKGPAAQCKTCHEAITPQVKKHQQCDGCHLPHLPAKAVSAQCGSCHEKQAAVARSWPADSPHGANHCAQCHEKHDEHDKRACASCHEEQAKTQHMGVHEQCTGCHAPHVSPPTDLLSWWGRCASCHKSEGAAAASGNPKHQLCSNCHDNPARAPTQCLTCHTEIRKQGEHQQPKHAECTSCHATHGTTPPARKACESCHKDRKNHFPDAPKCQSCHPFTKE